MKTLKFTLVILLLTVASNLFAQNGQNPYLNSMQTYTVTMEDGANNAGDWVIANAAGVALAPQPTTTETIVGNVATLVITWDDSWAIVSPDSNPNYKIEFRETKNGTNCISLRSADITVQGNTFFLIAGADANACHDEDGNILAQGASGETTVEFTVTLDATTFALPIDSWEFDFALALTGTDYTITEVKVDGGAAITDYTGVSVAGTKNSVPVTVKLSGPVATAESVTLTVSNGKAKKGVIVTPDNATGDKIQELTINALPNTSNISFN